MVGYTGGSGRDPTYENIQDFAEGIRVEFDEAQLSFEDLLEAYLAFCTPAPMSLTGTQYRYAVFYHTPEQKAAANEWLKAKSSRWRDWVSVEPASEFFRAEEYHQHYLHKMTQNFAGYGSLDGW